MGRSAAPEKERLLGSDRPARVRPIAPDTVANAAPAAADGLSEAELIERLETALAALPPAERSAAVVAFGLDEGAAGVAAELSLSGTDAEALTRSALQLLRGALADADPDEPEVYARVRRPRKRTPGGDSLEPR